MVARLSAFIALSIVFAGSALAAPPVFRIASNDGIPIAKRQGRSLVHAPASRTGISKRKGVQLTAPQAKFVASLGKYLKSEGETALVTSGARTPQHQLAIIKSKVREVGAARRFPELRRASVSKPNTWLRAWQYLRAMHVPVYAPKLTPGVSGEISNHTKGLAVDLISGSLDHLHELISNFAHSSFAAMAPLRVVSIAREAGCVHINLAHK